MELPKTLTEGGLFCLWRYKPPVFQVMEGRQNLQSFDTREEAEDFSALHPGTIVEEHRSKVPYSPNGGMARSNDRKTFGSYVFTMSHASGYDGIGIGLFDGIGGIDLDRCIDDDGVLSETAEDILSKIDSYAEYSPSGTGIHIYFKTDATYDTAKYYQKTSEVELYLSGQTYRFLTVTGKPFGEPKEIREVPMEDIQYVLDKYMKKKGMPKTVEDGIEDWLRVDGKLRSLWNGKAPGAGANENQLDLALCAKLSWYTRGDRTKVDELFRSSPYYRSKDRAHLEKWEVRKDYREMTLDKAVQNVYTGRSEAKAEYTLDDTGNAHRFADAYKGDVLYCFEDKKWMIWNSKYWQTDVTDGVKNLVERMTEDMREDALEDLRRSGMDDEKAKDDFDDRMKNIKNLRQKRGKENCLSEAQHLLPAVKDDFDRDPWKLCTQDGIYDLRTGERFSHDKGEMMSQCTAYPADMEHEPRKFIEFLKGILVGHEENFDYIHRLLGYATTGSTREDQAYFLFGNGNDGKSLLLDIVATILGDYAATAKTELICVNKYATAKQSETQLAILWKKRFVTLEEMDSDDRLSEKTVKTLASSAGKIVARHLFAEEFTYRFIGKLIVATNYKPEVRGTDKGIWRRIVTIPFDLSLPEDKVDKDLKDKLMEEAPQILGWLIKGAMEYYAHGLEKTKSIQDITDEYRVEQDTIAQWVEERCDTSDDKAYSSSRMLFEDFADWRKEGHLYDMSLTAFGKNMAKKFRKTRVNGSTVYFGIKLKEGRADLSKARLVRELEDIEIDEDNI